MHFGDYTFIFVLALVLFGPKKLPEMGRQVGKLLAEFRRASNEFKFQIQEELRNMEEDERKKKLAESQALATASEQALIEAGAQPPADAGPTILPPSTGEPVRAARPFAVPVDAGEVEGSEPISTEPTVSGAVAAEPQEAITEESHVAIAAARGIPSEPSATNGSAASGQEAAAESAAARGDKLPSSVADTAETLTHG